MGLKRARRNIEWIEANLYVPEGALVGERIKLRPWQREIIQGIYGTPTRRAIVSYGRKNGKTALAAMLLLLHLAGPEYVRNSQLFSAARSREQASILFNLARAMVQLSPELRSYVRVVDSSRSLECREIGTLYRALSADATNALGLSPVFAVHDELGQVRGPRDRLYDALETASGAQAAPLSVIISTQAPTDADLLSVLIDDAETGADPTNKVFLYTADTEADPFARETIAQANPAFGDFQNADETMRQAESARRMPSSESSYRNLILNQRVNQSNPFMSQSLWEDNALPADPDVFLNYPVAIGIDLSARNDLTAIVAVARDDKGIIHVDPHFFTPEIGLTDRAHNDRVPYDLWAERGMLYTTPGATVEYDWVASWLSRYCVDKDVALIFYDRWRIEFLKRQLDECGADDLPLEPFGQGYKSMGPAVEQLESEFLNRRIRHGGHPVLTMCASNAVAVANPAGDRKLCKASSTGRIDGMDALLMAIAALNQAPDNKPKKYQVFFV